MCVCVCVMCLGCLNALLKEVVAEFTLTDNLASTTTSLLRTLCHNDDSMLLGTWLEETDHKTVEEMVGITFDFMFLCVCFCLFVCVCNICTMNSVISGFCKFGVMLKVIYTS